MQRLRILGFAMLLALVNASVACAQDADKFPDYPGLDKSTITKFPLGPGFYLSIPKLLIVWVIFLLWVRTLDWMSRDATELKLDYKRWNGVSFLCFLSASMLLFSAPWFWATMPLMLLAWFVPFVAYVVYRNKQVSSDETVFTAGHIRWWLSIHLRYIGIKIAAERATSSGPPVDIEARGKDDRTNAANLLLSKQSAGFVPVQEMLVDIVKRRAEAVLMDFTQAAVAIKYQIDGVWHDVEPRDRETGDAMLAVFKTVAGLDARQRVQRQEGAFGATYEKVKYNCRVLSQGTKTGERVLMQIIGAKKQLDRLPDLGMRDKLVEELKAALAQNQMMAVLSTPPQGGLSTLLNATVSSMDRYVRGFVGVESTAKKELDIENVPMTYFDPATGQNPAAVLPKLIREHPDVFIVPEMVDPESGLMLCDQVESERRGVVTTVRAKEASESLLRILMLKIPPQKFAPVLTCAVNQRLIRTLCPKCKEAYAPTPQMLQQLGIPAGRVEALYRPPQQPEEVCTDCQGIGYLGRTAMFEVLIVDDNVRQSLQQTPQLAAVRQAARRAGMRTLQEEGIVLVARGVTSLQELMRVLKE